MARLLCVGIDVATRLNRAQFVDDDEQLHGRLSFPNDATGASLIATHTKQLADKIGVRQVRFGLEATGFYGWHLAMYLCKAPELGNLQANIYLFNPRTVHGFKLSYPDLPKTDWADAFVIAERLRFGRLPKPFALNERYLPLQRLTRHRAFLVKDLVRLKNYFLGYLFLKCNRVTQSGETPDPLGASMSEVLTECYSIEDLARMPLDDLAQILIEKSHNRFPHPYEAARQLQVAATHSYRLPDVLKDPVNRILASTMQLMRQLVREIRATEQDIERQMRGLDCPLLTVPGIGPVLAAGIVAEIGDIHNFPDDDALAKFAGLTWRLHQTGDFDAEDRPLTRTGNAHLRYYLTEAANLVRRYAPDYTAYYQRKHAEVTKHQHKRALVLTARRLVRLIHALLRTGQPYSGPREEVSSPDPPQVTLGQ
jgi:transposase